MDATLLPRFGSASFCFLPFALIILFKSSNKESNIRWPSFSWPVILIFAYFIWSSLSICWAVNFSEAVFESQKVMIGLATFYMATWLQLNDSNFIPRLYKTMILVSLVAVIWALWQIAHQDWSVVNAVYEIKGFSGHKNLFSNSLFLLSAFLGMGVISLDKKWSRFASGLFIVILLLILFLKTRSTYLSIVAATVTFFIFKAKQWLQPATWSVLKKVFVIALILVAFIGIYAWQSNQLYYLLDVTKIDNLWQSATGYERLILWDKTSCVIEKAPLLGVGAGNWQIIYPDCTVDRLFSVEVDFTTFQRPHNDWLWVWAETGLIGFLLYLGFFLSVLQAGLQKWKKAVYAPNRFVLSISLCFIVGFMTFACFSFPKERIEILLLIYTLLSLATNVASRQNRKIIAWNKFILVLIVLSCSLNLYLTKERSKGERNIREVLILKQQQNWPAVITACDNTFSKWYTIDPTSIPIHWYRGTAQFSLENHTAALTDFEKAKQYAPYNQHIQNDLGSCYQLTGGKDKAKSHYQEAIRISPLFDDPRLNLGISYYNDKNYQEALYWINTIHNLDLKLKYQKIVEEKLEQTKHLQQQ